MSTRLLIVDDHPLVRAGIVALLAGQPDIDVVGQVCGDQAVEAAAAHAPDVVLLDLDTADGDGLDMLGRIVADSLRHTPERPVRVLAMTSEHRCGQAYAALRAGGAGLLLKSRPPEVLAGAVRAVAVAGIWLDNDVVRNMLRELSAPPAVGQSTSSIVRRLTPREREVLILLAHGLNNAEIARRLYLSEATARTHVGRILMKLHCPNRTRAVAIAYLSGLVRVGAEQQAA